VSLHWSLDASVANSAFLTDGKILTVARMTENEWLFVVPRDADEGPAAQQTQIRIHLIVPGSPPAGVYEANVTLRAESGLN